MPKMKRSEKGLLTPDNCVVTLIDHQPQMLFGVSGFDRQLIINNTVALAKATRVFDLPVVLSTVESKSFSGNIWPQLKAVFPNQVPVERYFNGCLGRQELCCRDRKERPRKKSFWPDFGRKSASRCQPSRPFTTATKSMWSKIAAAT